MQIYFTQTYLMQISLCTQSFSGNYCIQLCKLKVWGRKMSHKFGVVHKVHRLHQVSEILKLSNKVIGYTTGYEFYRILYIKAGNREFKSEPLTKEELQIGKIITLHYKYIVNVLGILKLATIEMDCKILMMPSDITGIELLTEITVEIDKMIITHMGLGVLLPKQKNDEK